VFTFTLLKGLRKNRTGDTEKTQKNDIFVKRAARLSDKEMTGVALHGDVVVTWRHLQS
jgi:hypothetical protein